MFPPGIGYLVSHILSDMILIPALLTCVWTANDQMVLRAWTLAAFERCFLATYTAFEALIFAWRIFWGNSLYVMGPLSWWSYNHCETSSVVSLLVYRVVKDLHSSICLSEQCIPNAYNGKSEFALRHAFPCYVTHEIRAVSQQRVPIYWNIHLNEAVKDTVLLANSVL